MESLIEVEDFPGRQVFSRIFLKNGKDYLWICNLDFVCTHSCQSFFQVASPGSVMGQRGTVGGFTSWGGVGVSGRQRLLGEDCPTRSCHKPRLAVSQNPLSGM